MALEIVENVELGPLTTFGVGGRARFFADVRTEAELGSAVEFGRSNGLETLVFGGGSNVLVSDDGFPGLVIRVGIEGISVHEMGEMVSVTAGAGEDWDGFVAWSVERNLQGLECLSGIPGLVGGAPIQNIGAYGQEVSETIGSVRAFDLESGEFVDFENESCGFAYRRSVFNSTLKGRHVIISVTFLLKPGGIPSLRYPELQSRFGGVVPTLAEVRETVCEIRRSKGMLVRQGGPDSRSAGSFFKNPIIGDELRQRILAVSLENGFGEPPMFPSEGGGWKVSAAWLVEKSGFPKGFRMGPAGVSSSHSLALVNAGGAKCRDILALRDLITVAVKKEFGVELVQEPVFIGDSE